MVDWSTFILVKKQAYLKVLEICFISYGYQALTISSALAIQL